MQTPLPSRKIGEGGSAIHRGKSCFGIILHNYNTSASWLPNEMRDQTTIKTEQSFGLLFVE